jgi:hypothetical protein
MRMYVYDPATDTWEATRALPPTGREHPAAVVIGGGPVADVSQSNRGDIFTP